MSWEISELEGSVKDGGLAVQQLYPSDLGWEAANPRNGHDNQTTKDTYEGLFGTSKHCPMAWAEASKAKGIELVASIAKPQANRISLEIKVV